MKLNRNALVVLLLVASACSALARDIDKQDLAKMRGQIGVFESVLNQNLTQAFPGPFAYLDKARGAYLPGYGLIFTFEVNLNPQPPSQGPFGVAPQTDAQRIATVKKNHDAALELSRRSLADFSHTLELDADEWVAIVIQGSAVGPRGIEKSTLVVRAQKKDIDQFRSNTLDRAAFLNRVSVVEY